MLPASLGKLSRLQSLKLYGSELAQALPDKWAAADSFPALAALDLTQAAQKWELPQSWSREGAFPALRELRLEGITLAGQLPRNEVAHVLMQSGCVIADCCLSGECCMQSPLIQLPCQSQSSVAPVGALPNTASFQSPGILQFWLRCRCCFSCGGGWQAAGRQAADGVAAAACAVR